MNSYIVIKQTIYFLNEYFFRDLDESRVKVSRPWRP